MINLFNKYKIFFIALLISVLGLTAILVFIKSHEAQIPIKGVFVEEERMRIHVF